MTMIRDPAEETSAGPRRARGATHHHPRYRELAGASTLRPLGDKEAQPMLVGRRSECEQLDRLLTRSRAWHGEAIVVHGDAGIGKTALLESRR